MDLSRKQTTCMKGLAILIIMIHNFVEPFFDIPRNEMIYLMETRDNFLSNVFTSSSIWYILSYAGWIGVPVFFFLSGYGLTKKYNQKNRLNTFLYIKNHIFKLLKLLLPIYLLYLAVNNFCFGNLGGLRSILAHMTFTINILSYGDSGFYMEPVVYWFFGAILQFYILFLFIRKLNTKWLWVLWVTFLIIHYLVLFLVDNDTMEWVRHNFLGWGTSFVLGMIAAKSHFSISGRMKFLVSIASFIILCVSLITKQLAPFVEISTIVLAICIADFIQAKWIYFIGVISASIFVVHPFIRMIILNAFPDSKNPLVMTIIYAIIVVLLSWLHHSALNKSFTIKGINSK